jgi:hypothetical protein
MRREASDSGDFHPSRRARPVLVRRFGAALLGLALLGAQACDAAEAGDIEPLPPLERPTPEQRAGLPTVAGRWVFAGFEYPAQDTLRVREQIYRLVPPGEFRVATQRLDSIAGEYVREGAAFPFTGEVRRDGHFAWVAFDPAGAGSFVSGRFARDTMWVELTSFGSAATWPPSTRAAFVRMPRGAPRPFTRLRGYVPPPPDTAADSAAARPPARTPITPSQPPARVEPQPPAEQPPVRPAPEQPPVTREPPARIDTPREEPVRRPPPRPAPRETIRYTPPPPPPPEEEPEEEEPEEEPVFPPPTRPRPLPTTPPPAAPRETIRIRPPG